jgi:hypothetical protein
VDQLYLSQTTITGDDAASYDTFVAQWQGTLVTTAPGVYQFRLDQADGAILFIDHHPVIYALSLPGDVDLDGQST